MNTDDAAPAVRPVRGIEIFAWTLYDWANSAYSTLSITILVVYLTKVVLPGDAGELAWAYGIGGTMFLAAFLSPVLGAIADARANKRTWLAWTTIPGAAAAIGMCFVSPNHSWLVVGLFLIANLGYELSQGFYNSFLPEIADENSMNRISAWGFALGYIGGGLALVLAILVLQFGTSLGLPDASARDRDFVHAQQLEFNVAVPDGEYDVQVTLGDAMQGHAGLQVSLNGAAVETVSTQRGEFVTRHFPTQVTGGRLRLAVAQATAGGDDAVLNALTIEGPRLTRPLKFDFGTPESPAEEGALWVTHRDDYAPRDREYLKEHAKGIPEDQLADSLTYGFVAGADRLGSRDTVLIPRLQTSLLIMGAWWALFSLPVLLVLRDRVKPRATGESLLATAQGGLRQVVGTLTSVRRYKMLFLFLIAFLIYNDGVQTIITQAPVFAQRVLNIGASELVMVVLMIQFASMPGALFMGWLAGKVGEKRALLTCIVIYIGWLFAAFFISTMQQFWAMGVVLALVMGGIQSVSRAIMGLMTPASRSGEFFGFFNLSGKATSILGPILFGTMLTWTGQPHLAILSLLVFFFVGGGLVLRVNVAEGHLRALEE